MASPSHLVTIQNQKGRMLSAELAADVAIAIPAVGLAITTFYTTPGHGATEYLACAYIAVSTAGAAGNFAYTLTYTDPDTAEAETFTGAGPATDAKNTANYINMIRCSANSVIRYTIGAGGAAAVGKLTIALIRLR